MTIEIINGTEIISIESNNVPRVGDTYLGLEVTKVEWNDDLSGVKVSIGRLLNWVTIDTPEGRWYRGLDFMPVVGDYI